VPTISKEQLLAKINNNEDGIKEWSEASLPIDK